MPVVVSVVSSRDFIGESRLAEDRFSIERRAEEILSQDQLAPHRWAARLAPDELPQMQGFEIGKVFKAGTGLMAGDFYDVFRLSPTRMAAVIGDVTGHGIEPSITALQAKYLLRVFLRRSATRSGEGASRPDVALDRAGVISWSRRSNRAGPR